MEANGRWAWERMFLVLAVLFAVVAMHSLVVALHCGADDGPPGPPTAGTSMALVASTSAQPTTEMTGSAMAGAGVDHVHVSAPTGEDDQGGGCGHAPIDHLLGHLCLAVLGIGLLSAIVLAVVLATARSGDGLAPRLVTVRLEWPRPPPRIAVRLAQLSVMRN